MGSFQALWSDRPLLQELKWPAPKPSEQPRLHKNCLHARTSLRLALAESSRADLVVSPQGVLEVVKHTIMSSGVMTLAALGPIARELNTDACDYFLT